MAAGSSAGASASAVSDLLQPPGDSETLSYYEPLLEAAPAVRVQLDVEGKGKGLIAARDIAEGEVLFREECLVGAQHTANKAHALVCQNCFRYVGSIEVQIAHRLLASEEAHGVDGGHLGKLLAGDAKLPHSEKFPLPEVVGCSYCSEAYCSVSCRNAAWHAHHCLLCPSAPDIGRPAEAAGAGGSAEAVGGSGSCTEAAETSGSRVTAAGTSGSHAAAAGTSGSCGASSPEVPPYAAGVRLDRSAWAEFVEHADFCNDIFHLNARAIAAVLLAALRELDRAPGKDAPHAALRKAWLPYAVGWKTLWWDAVGVPPDVDDHEQFRADLRTYASDSLALLRAALYDDRFPELFSLEVYASLVGMYEQNNLALVVPPPVENYLLHIEDELPEEERQAAQRVTAPLLDALGDDYAAACEGSAFFRLHSVCNHSCVPNVTTMKEDGDDDGCAVLRALCPIAEGEELTVSYVDPEEPLEEREVALKDYGFVCG